MFYVADAAFGLRFHFPYTQINLIARFPDR